MQINKDQQRLIMLLIELVDANGLLSGLEEERDLAALAEFMEQIQEDRRMADTNNTERKSLEDFAVRKLAAIGAVYAPHGLVERRPIEYRRELEDQFVRGYRAAESSQPNAALADGWMPVSKAPRNSCFLAGIWVRYGTADVHWEQHSVYLDSVSGEPCYVGSGDPTGWEMSDYEGWQPLPAPPTLNASKE